MTPCLLHLEASPQRPTHSPLLALLTPPSSSAATLAAGVLLANVVSLVLTVRATIAENLGIAGRKPLYSQARSSPEQPACPPGKQTL